jgi:hypothetical protein
MPVQLDQKNHAARGRPCGRTGKRAQPRQRGHDLLPAAGNRRKQRRSSCSSRAEDAVRLLGSARMTN